MFEIVLLEKEFGQVADGVEDLLERGAGVKVVVVCAGSAGRVRRVPLGAGGIVLVAVAGAPRPGVAPGVLLVR